MTRPVVQVAGERFDEPVDVVGRGPDAKTGPQGAAAIVDPSYQRMGAELAVAHPDAVLTGQACDHQAVNPLLDEGSLLLVFADGTTGKGSRPPSRFLLITPPPEGLDHSGTVQLDFNRAFLPPCAFSDEFNCPLPPSHHRFDEDVTAGETWPEFLY
jgi:uncharacterized protein (DUF1684 family)